MCLYNLHKIVIKIKADVRKGKRKVLEDMLQQNERANKKSGQHAENKGSHKVKSSDQPGKTGAGGQRAVGQSGAHKFSDQLNYSENAIRRFYRPSRIVGRVSNKHRKLRIGENEVLLNSREKPHKVRQENVIILLRSAVYKIYMILIM